MEERGANVVQMSKQSENALALLVIPNLKIKLINTLVKTH